MAAAEGADGAATSSDNQVAGRAAAIQDALLSSVRVAVARQCAGLRLPVIGRGCAVHSGDNAEVEADKTVGA